MECSQEKPEVKTGGAGWFKATRGSDALELIRMNPNAFILAYVIANRARWTDTFNAHGLTQGEAMLGDYDEYGMSERQYRTAKEQLTKWKFATFRTTNRGTIGKLIDTRLFNPLNIANDEPKDGQPTDSRRASDGQPTTNKEGKKETIEERKNDKASKRLSPGEKELAERFELSLGMQWINDAGKWISRIRGGDPGKCYRVISEVENAVKESRIDTTPAQYAEYTWNTFE